MWRALLTVCGLLMAAAAASPPFTDYCAMLGADDIQGKKHGFLAGNKVYYVGGTALVQQIAENETIGLTHPFFHDLRSRGTGVGSYPGVGSGNDFDGWEYYRATKVAYGSVVTDQMRWDNPPPTRMHWRPDRLETVYELSDGWLSGQTLEGWCHNWQEGSSRGTRLGLSFWVNLTEKQCWAHCTNDTSCQQANYEDGGSPDRSQCWIGLNKMAVDDKPTGNRDGCGPGCADRCFAPGEPVQPVRVSERKFITGSDVVMSTITADRSVLLHVTGQSFGGGGGSGQVVSLHGECSVDVASNSIRVLEGGTVKEHVHQGAPGDVYIDAKLMYDGMSGVLSASRDMKNVSFTEPSPGVCEYSFYLPLDSNGTTLAWTMDDSYQLAEAKVQRALAQPAAEMAAKTDHVNAELNQVVPYFRCRSDLNPNSGLSLLAAIRILSRYTTIYGVCI